MAGTKILYTAIQSGSSVIGDEIRIASSGSSIYYNHITGEWTPSVSGKYSDRYSFNETFTGAGSVVALKQPVPLMSYNEEMVNFGSRWGSHTSITLEGQLTGRNYNELMNLEDQLVSKFSQDFKNFVIIEDDALVFEREQCKIESISFDEGTHAGLANYNIKLSSFNRQMFSGTFGVTDPINSFSFSDNRDGTATVSHSVSAKGFNTNYGTKESSAYGSSTSSNAYTNAWHFVHKLTGWSDQVVPLTLPLSNQPILTSYTEKTNELEATYGIEETWMYNVLPHGGRAPSAMIWPSIREKALEGGGTVDISYSFPNGAKIISDVENCTYHSSSSIAALATDISAGFSIISDLFQEAIGVTLNFTSLGVEGSTANDFPLVDAGNYSPKGPLDECFESITYGITATNSSTEPYIYDLSTAGVGDFRITIDNEENPVGAHATFPAWRLGTSGNRAGDMYFGNAFVLDSDFNPKRYNTWDSTRRNFKFTFVHEALHSLGLDHTYDDVWEDIMSYADVQTEFAFNWSEVHPPSKGLISPTLIGHIRSLYGVAPTRTSPLETTSTSISSGIDQDFVTVDLEYTLKGGLSYGMTGLRSYLNNHVDLWRIATGESNLTGLNKNPINFSINENWQAKSLTVSATYDDDDITPSGMTIGGTLYPMYFDYSTSFDFDAMTNTTIVSIDGSLISKSQMLYQKNKQIEVFLDNTEITGFLYQKTMEIYKPLVQGGNAITLNPFPENVTIDKNINEGTLSLSASFNDRDWFGNFKDVSYDVSISPSLPVYEPTPSFNDNGYYLMQDIGVFKRETVDISINATYARTGDFYMDRYSKLSALERAKEDVRTIYGYIGNAYLDLGSAVLESESLDFGNAQNSISLNMSFSQQPYTTTFTKDETKIRHITYLNRGAFGGFMPGLSHWEVAGEFPP